MAYDKSHESASGASRSSGSTLRPQAIEALADGTRRELFELLCHGPQSVGRLAEAVPVSRPAVSQHLRVLKDAGLVEAHAEGTRHIYRVTESGVSGLRSYIENLWESALAGFASVVEKEASAMSTEQAMIKPVEKSITVQAPIELAFEIFTERLGQWWPLATHSIGGDVADARLEGHVGGRIYEVDSDGREADWGVVSVWEPPDRFAMEWKVDPNASAPTVIDVRFTEVETGTKVELEHSHWERLGSDASGTRDGYDTGWDVVLSGFASLAEQ
ncbi:MAG: metalloregulator ArsR/SmtB family transcription factor [Acidimicrobiia bacterium]|nr:metalloregulator ArsR/SmtB family transcription factor [Acidimicrobiia bacterium]